MDIAKRVASIRPRLGGACLVAATKYVGPETIAELVACGVADIGENRADAYRAKRAALGDRPIRWHFIGHLQTNKAKDVVGDLDFLHSLDGLKLAAEIQKRRTTPLSCFVEVNVSGEPSKNGVAPDAVADFVCDLAKYDKIRVVGLMGMAAETPDVARIETSFRRLAALRDDIRELHLPHAPCAYLSMGMSGDFDIAVRCGATHVRLGSILFRNEE